MMGYGLSMVALLYTLSLKQLINTPVARTITVLSIHAMPVAANQCINVIDVVEWGWRLSYGVTRNTTAGPILQLLLLLTGPLQGTVLSTTQLLSLMAVLGFWSVSVYNALFCKRQGENVSNVAEGGRRGAINVRSNDF